MIVIHITQKIYNGGVLTESDVDSCFGIIRAVI